MGKTIAITGANGFIGQALVSSLHKKGHRVIAFVHRLPAVQMPGVVYHLYSLDTLPVPEHFADVDLLIHLAFQFKPQKVAGVDINMYAAKALKGLDIPNYVFVSSFAASDPVAPSYYGMCKREMESLFASDLIIRPGLVLGNGGLFGRMKMQLNKSKWVPLLRGGKQVIQTIFIDDLVDTVAALVENNRKGIYPIAHPESIVYKTLMQEMSQQLSKLINFVPVPVALMRLVIAAMQLLPKAPFNKDNLEGLLASRYIDTTPYYQQMNSVWLSPKETLAKLV